ncbi:MAG: endonuclease III [Coriobacteriia bacterium]|nr:endonuclease III [Coriobacteriia bacterium]
MTESLKNKKIRAKEIAKRLNREMPDADTELLHWDDPFKLVIAVALSAQTTDKMVNKVTPLLWDMFPTPQDLANADPVIVEQILRPIGFYQNKTKNAINCARMICDDFNGEVPQTMEELQKLPGVGRKTANIVLNVAFDQVEGIAVDTHVFRISHKLKLSNAKTPAATEPDLLKVFDKDNWKTLNHQLVLFGRHTCTARNPKCIKCPLADLCPSNEAPSLF